MGVANPRLVYWIYTIKVISCLTLPHENQRLDSTVTYDRRIKEYKEINKMTSNDILLLLTHQCQAQLSSERGFILKLMGADAETRAKHTERAQMKLFIISLLLELREPNGTGGGRRIVGAGGVEDTRRTQPEELTKLGLYELMK